MKEHIKRISKFIKTLNENAFYDTSFVVKNDLFIKERKGCIVGGHEIYYYVINRGLLKVRKKTPIGVSKRAILEIKGSDLKNALKIYYNL